MDVLSSLKPALEGSYRIERELGAGGMATVYLAHDLRHNREVALKVLHPEIAAAVSPERFLLEIQIAAQLQHPLILPLFDSGQAGGLYYYVMPRVVGQSLRQRLESEKQLPIEETVRLGREIAEALDYAHSKGVVHRDIKPENIMLSGGHPLIADFGIARATGGTGAPRLTSTGVMVGTPYYMSPEQALGDPSLDHRSDLYSLGCVMCEMLTGSPPFSGASLYAIISGHVSGTPTLKTRGAAIPAGLRAAIEKALAKDPAERFQSGAEFAGVLADPDRMVGRRRAMTPARRRIALAALGGAALAITAGLTWSRMSKGGKLDPNLVAVAPFDALGTGLEVWREGLMDMLSRNLNGAGSLRVVSPTVVVRQWSGRADAVSARAVGRRTGAGLSVVGSIVSAGKDSVRLEVTVVDVASSKTLGEIGYRGSISRIDMAVDSVTVGLLAAIGGARPIGAVRVSTVRSSSLPALKAYLQGEQFFRRGDWDSAGAHFERAVALDTAFALAFYRIFQTRFYKGTGIDSLMWSYALRAGALNRGLTPRESLMVVADSVLASVSKAPALDVEAQRSRQRVIATLELANRRFPDDPEVWYTLGRSRNRIGYLLGIRPEHALEALDRAIALDSAFAPAYIEAIAFATMAKGQDATRRYLEAYRRLTPKGVLAEVTPLALDLMNPRRSRSDAVARTLATAPPRILYHTMSIFEYAGDSSEISIRIARELVKRGHDPSLAADPALPRLSLGYALAFRGHLNEATQVLGLRPLYLISQIAVLGGIPRDDAGPVFDSLLQVRAPPSPDLVFALPFWAGERDTAKLDRAIGLAQSASHPSPATQFLGEAARAWRALAIGDSAGALTRFLRLPTFPNQQGVGDWERYSTIRLLNDGRRFREALARLDREVPSTPFPWDVVLFLERARATEGLGQVGQAVEAYDRVAQIWARSDSVLQPIAAAARLAAGRLRPKVSR